MVTDAGRPAGLVRRPGLAGWAQALRVRPLPLAVSALSLLAAAAGYLGIWQRGMYVDDYSLHISTIPMLEDPAARQGWVRFLTYAVEVLLARAMPDHELAIRVAISAFAVANAWLLAWFVYRVLRSRTAALVALACTLLPAYAWEATLWLTASSYVLGTTAALLALHCFWSGWRADSLRRGALWTLAATAFLLCALLFVECFAVAAGLAPLVALGELPRSRSKREWRAFAARGLLFFSLPAVAMLGLFELVYLNAGVSYIQVRGGLDLSASGLASRLPIYATAPIAETVGLGYGEGWAPQAIRIGLASALTSPFIAAALALTIAWLGVALVAWRGSRQIGEAPLAIGLATLLAALVWTVIGYLVPAIFVRGQTPEVRFYYYPAFGFGLLLASLLWLGLRLVPAHSLLAIERLCVLVAGIWILGSSLWMLGYARTFELRSELDNAQLASFIRALPPERFPPGAILVWYPNSDETLAGADLRQGLASRFVGIFEVPWSSTAELQYMHGYPLGDYVWSNRWMAFQPTRTTAGGQDQVEFAKGTVPRDKTLVFTYRQGRIVFVERITSTSRSGKDQRITFPLARELRGEGVATLPDLRLPAQ